MIELTHIKEMICYYRLYMDYDKSLREISKYYNTNPMKVKRRLEMLKDYDIDKYNLYRKKVIENARKKTN